MAERGGCLLALFPFLRPFFGGGGAAESVAMPFRLRDDFLSAAELSFYRVLREVVADRAVVCVKVRLGDLFFVARPNENMGLRNKINQKHVDFVLCEPSTMQPLCGVELDDASHQRPKQIEKDRFQDDVFSAAGLPLVRVRAARGYVPSELAALLEPVLGRSVKMNRDDRRMANSEGESPVCAKCGETMVRREAKRGKNAGRTFWGCVNYPRCREVVE